MKKILAVAALLLFPTAAFAGEAQTTLKVSGWHCSGCAGDTVAAIKKLKGVKSATSDFEKKEIAVAYDDALVKPADFEKAVKQTGFEISKQ